MKLLLVAAFFIFLRTSAAKVPALFVFGDSWLDAGTNIYLNSSSTSSNRSPAADLPYGQSYFGYATGRFTDGRTLADDLAQALGLPLTPPFLKHGASHKYGANFASAGSRLLGPSNTMKLGVVSLKMQVDQLSDLVKLYKQQLGNDQTKALMNSSVLLLGIGSDDVQAYLSNTTILTRFTRQEFVNLMLERYRTVLLKFYQEGARKIVMIGLGPLGCTPVGRFVAVLESLGRTNNAGCLQSANRMAMMVNSGLRELTLSLNRNFSDLQLVLAKPFDLMLGVMNSPLRYGFRSAEVACCGRGPFRGAEFCSASSYLCADPTRYLFWDLAHLTETAYAFLFANFWRGNLFFVEPFNLYRLTAD